MEEDVLLAAYVAQGVSVGDDISLQTFSSLCQELSRESSESMQRKDAAEIVAAIAARYDRQEFPEVLPSEVSGRAATLEAPHTLSFARKTEAVNIQSFMDAEYQKYRTSMPEAALVDPEPVLRAKWSRANFYMLLRRITPVFDPEIAVDDVPEAERERCARLLTEVTASDAEAIPHVVDEAWAQVRSKLPAYSSPSAIQRFREDFLQQRYYIIVESVVQDRHAREARATYVFAPLLSPETAGGEQEQARATALAAKVQQEDEEQIAAAVDREWTAMLVPVPNFVREVIPNPIRDLFLQQRYYAIVADVVAARQAGEARGQFHFVPLLAPSQAGDVEQASRALALVGRVQAADADRLEVAVQREWTQFLSSIPASLKGTFTEEYETKMRQGFLKKRYYALVEEAVTGRGTEVSSAARDAGIVHGEKRSLPGESSPFKRRTAPRRTEPRAGSAAVVASSAAVLHGGPSDPHARWSMDGNLLWMPRELKMASVKDGRTQQSEDVAVLPLVISDASGPIGVELWRDAATGHFAMLKEAYEQTVDTGDCSLRVENVTAKSVKLRSLVPMKKLYSLDSTTIRVLTQGESRMGDERVGASAEPSLLITEFQRICGPAPFIVSLRGVVASCSEVQESRGGVDMCSFQLVDAKGQYLTCVAFGDNASAEELVPGNDICVYFAQGTKGRNDTENGKLWLYDEAVVKLERTGLPTPRQRTEIRIGVWAPSVTLLEHSGAPVGLRSPTAGPDGGLLVTRRLAIALRKHRFPKPCLWFFIFRGMPEAKTCSDPMAMRAGCIPTAKPGSC